MTITPTLRVAILRADHPPLSGYGDIFREWMKSGARRKGFPERNLHFQEYDVVEKEEYPKDEDVDAVLVTGSRANSFDNVPWLNKLVEYSKRIYAEQSRLRLIAVCFGHQVFARALGSMPFRNPKGWELSVCNIDLTPEAAKFFGKSKLAVHQVHQDVAGPCPAPLELWGTSLMCGNHVMYERKRLISMQGHPELTAVTSRRLLESRRESYDPAVYEDAISRVDLPQDGELIAALYLDFILDEFEVGAKMPDSLANGAPDGASNRVPNGH